MDPQLSTGAEGTEEFQRTNEGDVPPVIAQVM